MNRFCGACGKPVSSETNFCGSCGAGGGTAGVARPVMAETAAQTTNRKWSKNKILGVTCGVIFALLVIARAGDRNHATSDNTPSEGTSAKQTAVEHVTDAPMESVTGSTLVSAYEQNEVGADQLYKGKRLLVRGRVGEIKKDITDTPYLTIDEDEMGFRGVQAYFSDDDAPKLAQLVKGQIVEVIGTCDGLMVHVQLQHSELKTSRQ
jgi:hypothetical protein